jgi:hypothetical protein
MIEYLPWDKLQHVCPSNCKTWYHSTLKCLFSNKVIDTVNIIYTNIASLIIFIHDKNMAIIRPNAERKEA